MFKDNAGGKFVDVASSAKAPMAASSPRILFQGIARDLLAGGADPARGRRLSPSCCTFTTRSSVEVPEGIGSLEEFCAIVEKAPAWAEGLPIAAKARESARFSKDDGAPITAAPAITVELDEDDDDDDEEPGEDELKLELGEDEPAAGLPRGTPMSGQSARHR